MKIVTKMLPEIEKRVYQVRSELVYTHKRCGGRGYLPTGEGTNVCRCGCMIVFRYLKELMKANIPQDYWSLDFSELGIDKLVKKIINVYIENISQAKQKGLGLLLFGQNGTGKTSAMAEIAKQAVINGFTVKYFTLSSYVDAVFSKDTARVEYYENADFLMIDELDKKSGTSNIYKLVDEFMRRMFNQNKSLILGTNWDSDEFKEHLGESTFSLLKRRCEFLDFQGTDYSDKLQDSYIDRLKSVYDYFNPSIVENAKRMDSGASSQEED